MKKKVAIIYSSVDGQTKKICEKLNAVLTEEQVLTELYAINMFNRDILQYHTIVIGASIRYGKHNDMVSDFILNNIDKLHQVKTAFFSVNLVARKEDKNSPSTNPYMIKFLDKIDWKVDMLDVFAGKLDYKSYSFFDRIMIKLIMKITNGPTKSKEPIEFTDWKRVRDFGIKIADNYKIAL